LGLNGDYEFGPFRLLVEEQVLLRDGQPLPLTPKAFQILLALLENQGHVVRKEALMQRVWPDTFVQEDNITYHVSAVRKALGDGENGNRYIETVPRRGYRFVGVVNGTHQPGGTGVAPSQAALETEPGNGLTVEVPPPEPAISEPHAEQDGTRFKLLGFSVTALTALALAAVLIAGFEYVRPLPPPHVVDTVLLTLDGYLQKKGPLLTDGSRVYFEELVNDRAIGCSVSVHGGPTSPVPLPNLTTFGDISSDHSEFVGQLEDPAFPGTAAIVSWPVTGGPPTAVQGLSGKWPAWSPDGRHFCYVDGQTLYLAGGGGVRELVTFPGSPQRPAWSPDGTSIRLLVVFPRSQQTISIWNVDVERGRARQVFLAGLWPTSTGAPQWTPDGRYTVFTVSLASTMSSPGRSEIWARRENCGIRFWNCGKPMRVTTEARNYSDPIPSRDGRHLFVIGDARQPETSRYDLETGTLSSYLPSVSATQLDISRDGQWVTYVALPDHTLWRSRRDGTDPLKLYTPQPTWEAEQPHWSPDGTRIAFVSRSKQDLRKLLVVSATGVKPEHVVADPDSHEGTGTWSQDGNWIVYGEPVVNSADSSRMHIHLVNLATHQISTLLNSEGLWTARWSPDGRYIAALRAGPPYDPAISPELRVFEWKTGKWRVIARDKFIEEPAWSKDSQYVYFHTVTDEPAIYRVRVSDAHRELLVKLNGIQAARGMWSGVAPDGSPLLTRDVIISHIYALDVQWP
jgi:DNA-binding winged helix-turn-helix (wHTH) protein/Tol biopolymer transport system component